MAALGVSLAILVSAANVSMQLRNTTTILLCLAWRSIGFTDDLPPGVINTQNPSDISLTPAQSLSRMRVPEGFHVTLFAAEPDIRRPIAFDFDDRGRLWVVENYSHPVWNKDAGQDRIVILEDTNNDGQFDQRKVFWDEGRYLSGIAWGHGGVWVGNAPELSFIPDRNRDDVPDTAPIVKLDGFQVSQNNMLNNFHWGPDGWLYGAIGVEDTGYIGPPNTPRSARVSMTRGIWRYHPVREQFEKVATGMVNPWGADFNEWGDLITSNTVIAHLWHIVPGMHAQRRGADGEYPYAYEYIQSIADHLHWGGGRWQDSRETTHQHSVAGGGHAHCGGMIYFGDNWPDNYRGTFFTGNLHGNRLNNDLLVPRGSSYVATHGADFLFADDAWFRSLTQKYGPDGGVFVTDWHDYGECHDQDGSHRTTGRIYKVVYDEAPKYSAVDLQLLTDEQLVRLQQHKNEWYVRRGRRILHERGISASARELLRSEFALAETSEQRLRYLWTLFVTDSLQQDDLLAITRDENPYLRRWAVTLLIDRSKPLGADSPWQASNANPPGARVIESLARLADDPSPIVRLAVACGLRRVPLEDRWDVVRSLVLHEQDESDAYLPLLIWYATEPLIEADATRAMQLAANSRLTTVTRLIARRVADLSPAGVEMVLRAVVDASSDAVREPLLRGLLASAEVQPAGKVPASWERAKGILQIATDETLRLLAAELAVSFGDPAIVDSLRRTLDDRKLDASERLRALQSLARMQNGLTADDLLELLATSDDLRAAAILLLKPFANERVAERVLAIYGAFQERERAYAVDLCVAQTGSAQVLLEAIEQGKVSRDDVSAYALHTLRTLPSDALSKHVTAVFGPPAAESKEHQYGHYRALLSDRFLASADRRDGRKLFDATCAKCHRLFGEGNDFAPDLTGSGRRELDYLLNNLIDPSGLIDPAYRVTNLITVDGRLLSGFLVTHSERAVTLRTPDGDVTIPHADVELLETSTKSMMPEGLLQTYSDQQVGDLVRYLMGADQVE